LNLYDATAKLRAGATIACSGAFAFGPRDDQLAVANTSNLSLCNPATNDVRSLSCKGEIRKVQYLGQEKLVVATEDDVTVLNVATGEETLRLRHQDWVTALASSPDAHLVAIGDNRGNVTLWDVTTGKSSTLQAPGKSGHPWTLPASLLAILLGYSIRGWWKRLSAGTLKPISSLP
jgi:WD40 repeat protein